MKTKTDGEGERKSDSEGEKQGVRGNLSKGEREEKAGNGVAKKKWR